MMFFGALMIGTLPAGEYMTEAAALGMAMIVTGIVVLIALMARSGWLRPREAAN